MHSGVALVHQATNTHSYRAEYHLLNLEACLERGAGALGGGQRCCRAGTGGAEEVRVCRRAALTHTHTHRELFVVPHGWETK